MSATSTKKRFENTDLLAPPPSILQHRRRSDAMLRNFQSEILTAACFNSSHHP